MVCVESCASTNDLAFELLTKEGAQASGTVIFADHQTAGRGRRGRVWHSRPGRGILCSIALQAEEAPPPASLVAGAAVAVRAAIRDTLQIGARIKWPNDLLIKEKKVCGILVEARTSGLITQIIVGIGVNTGHDPAIDFSPELRETATSLAQECGREVERESFANCMIAHLDRTLGAALARDFTNIERDFLEGLGLSGAVVKVENSAGDREGGVLRGFSCVRGVEIEDRRTDKRVWHPAETTTSVTRI